MEGGHVKRTPSTVACHGAQPGDHEARLLVATKGTNAAQLLSAAPKGKVIDELEPGARLDLPFALAMSSEQKVYRYGMRL